MNEERIVLRAAPELKELVKQLAAAENRNVSNYITNLILKDQADKERDAA